MSATTVAAESLETAKAAFDAGDFRGCLTKLNSAMPPAPLEAGLFERSAPTEFLLLRAEAMLHLKQAELPRRRSPPPPTPRRATRVAGLAAATAGLIKASPGLAYKAGGESLDVVAAETRTKALSAFLEQKLKTTDAAVAKAAAAPNLNATRTLLPALKDQFAMETGISGEATHSSESSVKLAGHWRTRRRRAQEDRRPHRGTWCQGE